jgi:hypothetical protein
MIMNIFYWINIVKKININYFNCDFEENCLFSFYLYFWKHFFFQSEIQELKKNNKNFKWKEIAIIVNFLIKIIIKLKFFI